MKVVPNYYGAFRCIASECGHNCCIGWEIDIDGETLQKYDTMPDPLGARLKENILREETPHFILDEAERCPFLNDQNLCDLILAGGEDYLCEICAAHPRFCNALSDREEWGLGLCCEAAARLILGQEQPMRLLGSAPSADPILRKRDEILAILQDRRFPIGARIEKMLQACGAQLRGDFRFWAERFLELERLERSWGERLERLKQATLAPEAFEQAMRDREAEYEQFTVYLIYRHFAKALDEESARARAAFAALGYRMLLWLGAEQWARCGCFDFEDQAELARQFSAEIEYSDENPDVLLKILENPML